MIDHWKPMLFAALPTAMAVGNPAFADQPNQPGYYYGPGMMWDGGWLGMVFGSLMMILVVAAIVVLVVLAVRWLGTSGQGGGPPASGSKTALDILKERLARGEIDTAEFEERRRALGE